MSSGIHQVPNAQRVKDVYQAGERPRGEKYPGEHYVDLEAGGRRVDQADVRMGVEVEDAAEVRRYRRAVVVRVAEEVA